MTYREHRKSRSRDYPEDHHIIPYCAPRTIRLAWLLTNSKTYPRLSFIEFTVLATAAGIDLNKYQ